ncbi:MAG: hypothetical protein ACP5M4_03385 [Acidobacteriaceae bacterium]
MARIRLHLCLLLLATLVAAAQTPPVQSTSVWTLQSSQTTASLRGIHAVNSQIAWASGTSGTILRTLDGGRHWRPCAIPPNAAKLDFRAIWAFDARTAWAMSSGLGNQSRLYKTTDGCAHWTLLATNPDPKGFWDAMIFQNRRKGFLLGDPVHHHFVFLSTTNGGLTWKPSQSPTLAAKPFATGAFAASNASLLAGPRDPILFGTTGAWIYRQTWQGSVLLTAKPKTPIPMHEIWTPIPAPLAKGGPAAGIFAVAGNAGAPGGDGTILAVGGNYTQPNNPTGTAAWSADGGLHWRAATHPPHGYRSTVAWDPTSHAWITAGTNGSDVSYDNGKTWHPLGNGNWNAISLPFIVGPNGRIGRLNPARLPK